MRHPIALILAFALCTLPSFVHAQPKKKFEPIEIKKIDVGFRRYKADDQTAYKAGLWTPIYIEIYGGTDGVAQKPNDRDPPYLEITTNDSEDVGTTIRVVDRVNVEPFKSRTFIGYVKTGHYSGGASNRDITVVLKVNGREVKPFNYDPPFNVNIDAHVYLTLGPRIEDFQRAVAKIGREGKAKDQDDFRFNDPNTFYNVVYENDIERLPERWFGYNGIDLMILSTDKRDFLTGLNNHPEQLKAIAQWVRRGGRLVVPISAQTQDAVNAVLTNPLAWQPPIPVVPPKASANLQLDRLTAVEGWGNVQTERFERSDPKKPRDFVPIPIATLDPGRVAPGDWDLEAQSDANTGSLPLIASVRYGMGKITYMAFSLQDDSFFAWKGKDKFLQEMAKKLAPKAPANVQERLDRWNPDGLNSSDPASRLLVELDKFGVTVIDFGYVALFIVLYILIVGPLDFFLLKYVFKRLEWTWITFPAVVLAVSVIAYFAAYALKGKDLKINKVDIVDFDLRTSREQPRVYGHSFFTILSPRIQNYTVGLEPNPEFWGDKADKTKTVDLMSWMGRPSGGFNGMDRGGSGGFFRKPYVYSEDASGLRGVPIPVWTTKAFMASWEQPLTKPPFVADLVWHKDKAAPVTGKIENHLGVDLVDVWLIHEKHFYPVDGGLKSVNLGAVPGPLNLGAKTDGANWVKENKAHDDLAGDSAASFQQTMIVKQMLFHDFIDGGHVQRNHLLRPLDFGWRIDDRFFGQNDRRTREVILFARVRPKVDAAETLTIDPKNPLPTKLWLGDLPDQEKKPRPALSGQLNQDTYIRVLLPVRPADE
jgi:hypothetical protein